MNIGSASVVSVPSKSHLLLHYCIASESQVYQQFVSVVVISFSYLLFYILISDAVTGCESECCSPLRTKDIALPEFFGTK